MSEPGGPGANRGNWLVVAGLGVLLAALLAIVVFLELGDGDDGAAQTTGGPDPTEQPATTAESTTTTDPYAVPDQIDLDYVNRVLEALYEVETAALRGMVAAGSVTPEAEQLEAAIYTSDWLPGELQSAQDLAQTGFAELRTPPGSPRPQMSTLHLATEPCVVVEGTVDYSGRVVTPSVEALPVLYVLVVEEPSPSDPNPTPWRIARSFIPDQRNLNEALQRCGAS